MIGALRTLGVSLDGAGHRTDGRRRDLARRGRQRGLRPGGHRAALRAAASRRWAAEAVTFDGDEQARSRPIAPLLDGLRGLGVRVDGDAMPFRVHGAGSVAGGTVHIDASASSQFVSGLLLSGATFTDGLTVVHTGDVGAVGAAHGDDGVDAARGRRRWSTTPAPNRWQVHPGPVAPRHWVIEPDLSNAVPFLAAAVVTGGHGAHHRAGRVAACNPPTPSSTCSPRSDATVAPR